MKPLTATEVESQVGEMAVSADQTRQDVERVFNVIHTVRELLESSRIQVRTLRDQANRLKIETGPRLRQPWPAHQPPP